MVADGGGGPVMVVIDGGGTVTGPWSCGWFRVSRESFPPSNVEHVVATTSVVSVGYNDKALFESAVRVMGCWSATCWVGAHKNFF